MSNGKKPDAGMVKRPPTIVDCVGSPQWETEIKKVLPAEVVMEAFLRVTRTTASAVKFAQCDPRSFLAALLKCARAGLLPDGVQAHLIPFGKEVQAVFDWKGLVDLAARNGIQVIPKLVCEHDDFSVQEDDGTGQTKVIHKWGLGGRGQIVGVYARAKLKDGTCDYEFMTTDEVENVRQNYSRAKNSEAWIKSWGEMAKKTPIKRLAKRLPMSPEIKAAMNLDDDSPGFELEPTKVVRPLFQRTQQQIGDPMLGEREPEPEDPALAEAEAAALAEKASGLRALCAKDGVQEAALLAVAFGTGTAGAHYETIEDLVRVEPDAANKLVTGWNAFVKSVKSAK